MEVQDLLVARGGVATRADLLAVVSRAEVDQALRRGDLVAVARGRYAVPAVEDAVRAAHALGGILSRESAALHHGWAVKTVPTEPHVSVPRNHKLAAERIKGVQIHRDDLHPDDVEGVATSKEVTLTQCLRSLSWDAALAVADSALRAGHVALLSRVGVSVRGPGSPQVRRAVREARAEAANPFESVRHVRAGLRARRARAHRRPRNRTY